MASLLINGMYGLGDNLHQRAIVRQLIARGFDIWLQTSWPSIYHDFPNLKLLPGVTQLRTQAKNIKRESGAFTTMAVPPHATRLRVFYTGEQVRRSGSILAAMLSQCGLNEQMIDFRLPIPLAWKLAAETVVARLNPRKPILIYRPLVLRTEWKGCASRNPAFDAYRTLYESIRQRFFVISLADLAVGKNGEPIEWEVGHPITVDAMFHAGELPFETMAALFAMASMVYCSPGFAPLLAQAVGTPVIAIFGGHEDSRTISAGARLSPTLGIDPIHPCQCFEDHHACDKAINLPVARHRIAEFVNAALADRREIGVSHDLGHRLDRPAEAVHEPGRA